VIIRIAEGILMNARLSNGRWDERARCRIAAAQAGATQRVEHTLRSRRVEIHVERVPFIAATCKVAVMLPLAADAEIPQNRAAIHLAEWRAQLATVRDVVDGQARGSDARERRRGHRDTRLIDIAVIQITAARYTAGHRQHTDHVGRAVFCGCRDSLTPDIVDTGDSRGGYRCSRHTDIDVKPSRAGHSDVADDGYRRVSRDANSRRDRGTTSIH